MDFEEIGSMLDSAEDLYVMVEPYIEWARSNWMALVLTGEILGAVVAIKFGRYRLGLGWLVAALATIWMGGMG